MARYSQYLLMITLLLHIKAQALPELITNATLLEQTAIHVTKSLRSHIISHDRVVLATCKWHWDPIDHFWLKTLPWAVTTWKLLDATEFRKSVIDTMHKGIKTNVLVRSIGKSASTCLDRTFRSQYSVYQVDWILMEQDDGSNNMLSGYVTQTSVRNFSCDSIHLKHASNLSKNVFPTLFSRGCHDKESNQMVGKHSELRNKVIRAACIDIPHFRPANNKPNCNSWETDVIFDALTFYNVTVVQTFYVAATSLIEDMCYGYVDVHRNLAAANMAGALVTYNPGLIMYWYETFYAKRSGPVMLSFYKLLQESKLCLALVAVTLMFALVFFVAADTDRLRSWHLNSTVDSFTFLLAALYSTSYSIPQIGRWTGLCCFVCSLWLLGMLPFSNYFRGELTSRVTLRGFPEHLDTLEKLELALDKKRVVPCVVKDSFLHEYLASKRSGDTIRKKLSLAFQTHGDRDSLVHRTWVHCLKCALREDRICLAVSLPQWFRNPYKRSLVESQERLSLVMLTNALRRNYPHRAAFRDLVRRITETGLLRPPEEKIKQGVLMNYREQLLVKMKPLEFEELASFLGVSMVLLALSAVLCLLEVATHGKRKPIDQEP